MSPVWRRRQRARCSAHRPDRVRPPLQCGRVNTSCESPSRAGDQLPRCPPFLEKCRSQNKRLSGKLLEQNQVPEKKAAIAPAEPATTITAQTSSTMSTILPHGVSGFLICEETVRSCTVVKKRASPKVLISVP